MPPSLGGTCWWVITCKPMFCGQRDRLAARVVRSSEVDDQIGNSAVEPRADDSARYAGADIVDDGRDNRTGIDDHR